MRPRRSSRPALRQAGGVPTARAPGRVTIIGDHTDYNGGLSLPMAIDLATEVTFTPKPGSFLVGIDSDQFPDQPFEIALGGAAPVPTEALLAAGLLRLHAPPSGGSVRVTSTLPVGAGLSSSAAFSRRAPPRPRARPRPGRTGPHLPGGRAQRGIARRPARPAGHRRRTLGPRAPHRLRDARDPAGPRPRRCGLRHRAQREPAPVAHDPLRHPARRVRAGRPHPRPAARHLRARRPERAERPRAAPEGPPRGHRVWPGRGSRAAAGPGQPERPRRGDDRGPPQPGGRLPGLGARGRRTGRASPRPAGGPRGPHDRRRLRRLRHRAVPARLAGLGPRGARTAPAPGGSVRLPAQRCLRRSHERVEHARRPAAVDRLGGQLHPARQVGDPSRHHERGGGVQDPDVPPGAPLTLEHRTDDAGVEGGVPAPQVRHRRRWRDPAQRDRSASRGSRTRPNRRP